jgi:class 3 adenylate cyclase/tetratricopeptide (TPR) repeat protein
MASSQWCFADFRLDPDNACLWRGTQSVALTPKAFDVLHYLVTHPDRLVTKDTLLDAVWPETAISDAVVRIAIGELRRALGDTAQASRFIATVHRRGYRFLAPVTPVYPPETVQAERPQQPAVPTSHAPTVRVPPEDERKQVTVLFADIKDSLALIHNLDPEAAQQLLDPALHLMMDVVHRYGGTVNQVLGYGIMVLFGAPIAHEDHAVRACYTALAMLAAVRAYAEDVHHTHGLILKCHIGLNSGEVVVRAIRNDLHMDYSAVGKTTHLAARMEQLASPDRILFTAATMRLVEGLVRVKPLGPMPVQGLNEPVEVFELLGASGRRRRLQTARARGLTRFVGRQTELAALHAALAQAGAGHGQVVAVVGEVGVGKSRLVDEFVQAAHGQGWLVLESAAVSYGQGTPYFPVLDLLRRYCHLEEGETASMIQAKVTEQILMLGAALQDTIPALLALLDALSADSPFLQLEAPQRRQRTLTALKWVLLRQSQGQPLLLVIEDLHWLDTETQALLDSLSESLPTARLLLLVNYRPDYRHGWGSKTYYTQVRLDPLLAANADAFLQALLGDDSSLASLIQLLIQRTEGNPFFLEESVQTLVEMGVLVGEPGAYCMAQDLSTIRVPATVQAVLAARIDRLPSEEKRLLQTAAVIGMEVPLTLLQAVTVLPSETIRLGLLHLRDAEFLYEASLFPELVYTFKHALTQEVAYGSLLQEQRRTLHAQIVVAIEALYADRLVEQVERLAHHALRGEMWDKALPYCRQAGDKAFARAAFHEAAAALEQALVALRHLPESRDRREQEIDLRIDLRTMLASLGEHERLFAHLRQAEILAEALEDRRRLGQVSALVGWYLRVRGDYDRSIVSCQRALAIADVLGDDTLRVLPQYVLGGVYHVLGDYRRATGFLRSNLAFLEGELLYTYFGAAVPFSLSSRNKLIFCLAQLGEFAEAIARSDEGLRIAETIAHATSFIFAYTATGRLYLCKGDFDKAISALERSLALCQEANFRYLFVRSASDLGAAYMLDGRVAEALPLLEQGVQQATSIHIQSEQSLRVAFLSEAILLAGRLEEALTPAQQALELARRYKERGNEAWSLRLLGEITVQRKPQEIELTASYYCQALALAKELGMRPLQAHCHRGLGTLYAKTGQHEQALAELSASINLYHAMDMIFWLPQTEAALAQIEGRSGQ